tara:strand:- start:57 stop:1007 length:951 start_codon:yes stop_codon:yes gene_type:complete
MKTIDQTPHRGGMLIFFIAKDQDEIDHFWEWYGRVMKYFVPTFKKRIVILTQNTCKLENIPENVVVYSDISSEDLNDRRLRFKLILDNAGGILKSYDWFVVLDPQARIQSTIRDVEFLQRCCGDNTLDINLFGAHHICSCCGEEDYKFKNVFDCNPESETYIDMEDEDDDLAQAYLNGKLVFKWVHGSYWGGRILCDGGNATKKGWDIPNLLLELERKVDLDIKNNIVAKYEDESYINKVFYEQQFHTNIFPRRYSIDDDYEDIIERHYKNDAYKTMKIYYSQKKNVKYINFVKKYRSLKRNIKIIISYFWNKKIW